MLIADNLLSNETLEIRRDEKKNLETDFVNWTK